MFERVCSTLIDAIVKYIWNWAWAWIAATFRRCSAQRCQWWCLCCNKWLCWIVMIILAVVLIVVVAILFIVAAVICVVLWLFCAIGCLVPEMAGERSCNQQCWSSRARDEGDGSSGIPGKLPIPRAPGTGTTPGVHPDHGGDM